MFYVPGELTDAAVDWAWNLMKRDAILALWRLHPPVKVVYFEHGRWG